MIYEKFSVFLTQEQVCSKIWLRPTGLLVINFVKTNCFKGIKNQVSTRLHWSLTEAIPGCVSVSTNLPSRPQRARPLETTGWHTKEAPLSLAASLGTQPEFYCPDFSCPPAAAREPSPLSLSRGCAGKPEGFSPCAACPGFTANPFPCWPSFTSHLPERSFPPPEGRKCYRYTL